MMIFYLILSFLLGLVFASFVNVCVYRIPRHESVVFGRSHCTACGRTLSPPELIPVASYLFLRGRCKTCGAKISARYPAVEAAGGVLFALCYLAFGLSVHTLVLMALACALLTLSLIDRDTGEIPDRFPVLILALAAIDLPTFPEISPLSRLAGLFAVSVPLFLLAFFTGGIGGGDVKLTAAAGALLGLPGILLSAFLGCVAGGIYAGALLLTGKKARTDRIAFGPFLSAGIFAAALVGRPILAWYASLLF